MGARDHRRQRGSSYNRGRGGEGGAQPTAAQPTTTTRVTAPTPSSLPDVPERYPGSRAARRTRCPGGTERVDKRATDTRSSPSCPATPPGTAPTSPIGATASSTRSAGTAVVSGTAPGRSGSATARPRARGSGTTASRAPRSPHHDDPSAIAGGARRGGSPCGRAAAGRQPPGLPPRVRAHPHRVARGRRGGPGVAVLVVLQFAPAFASPGRCSLATPTPTPSGACGPSTTSDARCCRRAPRSGRAG